MEHTPVYHVMPGYTSPGGSKYRPVFSWTSKEFIMDNPKLLDQISHLAQLPFVFKGPCLMADGQEGYGMPIGGVIATDKVIIPNAVGKDIGCGMLAFRTDIRLRDFMKYREAIMQQIFSLIPVGTGMWHTTPRDNPDLNTLLERRPQEFFSGKWEEEIRYQIETLGSGNHFIQIDVEVPTVRTFWPGIQPLNELMDGYITVMFHTGSRNLGAKIADRYDKIARNENVKWYSEVPVEWELAFLPIDTSAGREYRAAMNFALSFALLNRNMMAKCVKAILSQYFPGVWFSHEVDVHHNYAAYENHFGKNLLVHRKGAVKAVGEVIIPGSMETGSFLGRGLENEASFKSCSHGAGRELSRQAAKKLVSVETIVERMAKNDILLLKPEMSDVGEECQEAYKPIDDVMLNQQDLVAIHNKLRPVAVIKG